MAKPTGIVGPIRISSNPDGSISASFQQVTFPTEKPDIETNIVNRFMASVNRQMDPTEEHLVFTEPTQNEENDFDFTFRTPIGHAYLELMEIAPLEGPYEGAAGAYKSYDFAKAVFDRLMEKSNHYAKTMDKDVYLLLYPTHWAFALSPPAKACIRYWCARNSVVFRAIFYFQLLGDDQGFAEFLFPVLPETLGEFDPELIRGHDAFRFDPRKGKIDGEAITWDIG